MRRTLKDTPRGVTITIDNIHDEGWRATAAIDGAEAPGFDQLYGATPQNAFALICTALEEGGDLNDVPAPIPHNEMLHILLRQAADAWSGSDLPDWREDEYMRGQIELIWNTCNVRTSPEEELDTDDAKDRIWEWIEKEA